jgi:DNA polymerase
MSTCGSCSMCELGLRSVSCNGNSRDPHLLSNMQPSKFMIVGLCPDWDDLTKRQPLSGPAGDIFDREIARYNRSRTDFYICNLVRCWIDGKPQQEYIDSCAPFLQMEMKLLKPKLIIALGQFVFQQLCPDDKFCDSVGKIRSGRYGKVFAVHYPSLENITEFRKQISLICRLLKATE